MSGGGFFRGTSADQDTRFSNKQAKLLKSQKFAPELEHLVDATKVKMDVIRPWIATRVTELLGFEDEVLINFIYGLLDGKDVNGKEIQIQLTGFMEKNTGKFMRDLWSLLLSAQKNASGVPQQFLDAKEDELRKKKVELDRITLEIQKKKEVDQVKMKDMMDGELDSLKLAADMSNGLPPNHSASKASDVHPKEDKDLDERNGSPKINRQSRTSASAGRPSSSERISPRSISKSFSNSRSQSDGRHRSRSISVSPESRRRSISPERRYRSPRKNSVSPRYKDSQRRPRSPIRRRSPYSRRRSSSHSWRRSPSPRRHVPYSSRRRRSPSPWRRKSPSLRRHRSPSPRRRRTPSPTRYRLPSPLRRRSPSPIRRRSPHRRRSPSPVHRRSPSPMGQRSPIRSRRSLTPPRRRSTSLQRRGPSTPRRRSPFPIRRKSPPARSPKHRRSPLRSPRKRNRSPSPYRGHSPDYQRPRSLSRDRAVRSNGVGTSRRHIDYEFERNRGDKSPARHSSQGEGHGRKSHQKPISLMSPQRDPRDRGDIRQKKPVLEPSAERSPSQSENSLSQKTNSVDDKRSPPTISESPVRQRQERRTHANGESPKRQAKGWAKHDDTSESGGEEESHRARGHMRHGQRTSSPAKKVMDSPHGGERNISSKDFDLDEYSSGEAEQRSSKHSNRHMERIESRKKEKERKSEKPSTTVGHRGILNEKSTHTLEEVEYGPGRAQGVSYSPDHGTDKLPLTRQLESDSSNKRARKPYLREDRKVIHSHDIEDRALDERKDYIRSPSKRVVHNNQTRGSDSEENEKNRSENVERRKHKSTGKHDMASDDDSSHDSHIDERKEAKRRRKEEKKLRKEERRQKREERRRRREEKRTSKLKNKIVDTVTPPSDIDNYRNGGDESDAAAAGKDSHPSEAEEMESEQKKLEIELRKRALESLRAKKANNA
ncbi:hypothetical protein Scep_015854 [Stephania cephalantha]|uniref:PWI domain-containing protein n=1 Tax=Stephania cephalantha TaxID=152367 RepID=A0AAP0J5Z2_9MAGN